MNMSQESIDIKKERSLYKYKKQFSILIQFEYISTVYRFSKHQSFIMSAQLREAFARAKRESM